MTFFKEWLIGLKEDFWVTAAATTLIGAFVGIALFWIGVFILAVISGNTWALAVLMVIVVIIGAFLLGLATIAIASLFMGEE